MKNILKYAAVYLLLGAAVISCTKETTPDRINIQHPDQQSPILRDNAYYQNLRAYKQTKHKLAFGWYGSWTAVGASYQTRLVSAPDSMDIISIWSQWHSLTQQQKDDKAFVQQIMGTKVIFTIFAHDVPEQFLVDGKVTPEGLATYAKAYAKDSMDKYQYDGIDLDYEPNWGGVGPLVDGCDVYWKDNPADRTYNDNMTIFVKELSKWVGPKSGSGRLLVIDGVPFGVHPSVADHFDYGIVQAYNCSSATSGSESLQGRFTKAFNGGWTPEQYIFTENFEDHWKTGGVNHTDRQGNRMPSLFGMAIFNPDQGVSAGFGAYHMEYEYGTAEMPYKYMRQAIQMANPAGGWKTPIEIGFSTADSSDQLFFVEDDGKVTLKKNGSVGLAFSRPTMNDLQITPVVDNSLVASYNEANGTAYKTIDPSVVKIKPVECPGNKLFSPNLEIDIDPASIETGYYLVPVVISPVEDSAYALQEDAVHYLFVRKLSMEIETGASALDGVKITPTADWTINCYQGTASSGATGVWYCDSAQEKARMFDGNFGAGWFGNSAGYSWGNGGNFIIDMGEVHDITGFRWHIFQPDSGSACTDFAYSENGKSWHSLSGGKSFNPVMVDNWKYFKFKKTVKARYIRVYIGPVYSKSVSMDEAEVYGPAN